MSHVSHVIVPCLLHALQQNRAPNQCATRERSQGKVRVNYCDNTDDDEWEPHSDPQDQVEILKSLLRCVAVCCGVLRCVAVCCGVLRYCDDTDDDAWEPYANLRDQVCCSVLQCVAVCCSVL